MYIAKTIHIVRNSRLTSECFSEEGLTAAYVEALAALEKQNPGKITLNSEEDRTYEDFICPNCKDILQQRLKGSKGIVFHYAYCPTCGKALDWRLDNAT